LNTVEIGNKFEEECTSLIVKAIEDEKFAFPLKYAKVIPKAKYYCRKRESNIIFDIAIEIWPPDSQNYSNLYLIECKAYSSKKVPVGDLEKFQSNVNSVAELNGKAVFITNSSYTDTEIKLAKNIGMMLIQVENETSLNILLHKTNRNKTKKESKEQSKEFSNFIRNVFNPLKIKGLKKLSNKAIEKFANEFLSNFKSAILNNYQGYELSELIEYCSTELNIKTEFVNTEEVFNVQDILGLYDNELRIIYIDNAIKDSDRLGFVLAHELGHALLHSKIEINNELYNEFSDSEYNFETDKHLLTNYKHWIEWQANKFASCLLVPELNLRIHLVLIQKQLGISKFGHIYLDKQPVNIKDFINITNYLKRHFNTSKTTIEYKMQELNLITYDKQLNRW